MEENNRFLILIKDKEISEFDKITIEGKLWNLLGKRTERYTMGDSTSVPIEFGEELLKSICFSLRLELMDKKNIGETLKNEDFDKLLTSSWSKIEELIDEGKLLLEWVMKTSPNIENISYVDTLKGIELGFKMYDYRFLAHSFECSIDYQLSNPVSESLQGIEYINQYLTHLGIENEFCMAFDSEKMIKVLENYCEDYKGLLINIFEPVLTNALGLEILGERIFELEITELQRERLIEKLGGMSKDGILEELINSSDRICNALSIYEHFKREYIQ
ncbi:MAG: DUF6179 domain-containing protein, partial [Clostridium sp.]